MVVGGPPPTKLIKTCYYECFIFVSQIWVAVTCNKRILRLRLLFQPEDQNNNQSVAEDTKDDSVSKCEEILKAASK